MVLADVFPQEKNSQIMKRMIETLFPIRNIATPYMYSHVVEALFHAELHEEAIQLMKGYWGKMIELGADTFWEAFDPCLLYTSPSPRDISGSRMPSSA